MLGLSSSPVPGKIPGKGCGARRTGRAAAPRQITSRRGKLPPRPSSVAPPRGHRGGDPDTAEIAENCARAARRRATAAAATAFAYTTRVGLPMPESSRPRGPELCPNTSQQRPGNDPRSGTMPRATPQPSPPEAPEAAAPEEDAAERSARQHRLVQRDRMAALGTLAAGVAHEINNPLTYLLVNVEHVLRRVRAASASDDPIAELTQDGTGGLSGLAQSLQHAVEGANRVRQIVRDLLTFAQGNVEQRGPVDVRGILESATQMAWHEIRHRARLVKSFAEVPPVDANEARLGQVFLNLLVNAAQAIPEGQANRHEIRVATRTNDDGYAVVEVSDTGTGIAPEHLPRIFDPFFTTKGEGGTGLGLSISLGTIKALGGDIRVTSSPQQGTTFQVLLPPAKPWRGTAPSSSHDVRALPRRRLLVVDDERLVGEAI